ncbi:FAD-dependent oxidoreductase [Solimicrobium silvestre]|uniref:FAD binding domain n=1 Tax=Solimicrobium silvestre TaxID=2099400 RepID=A0A2S9GT39_9BURK|nr:FAD-dependent oxidoreductase [Solimicrobium silvestre]PRC90892.1 FAD binding domain [Solimicrobium silvestre]
MNKDYQSLTFTYQPRQAKRDVKVHPVVVVGAGPVGLSAAIALAQQGIAVVLVDDDHTLSTGSRAICFAQHTLDIFNRLGCGEQMTNKGVSWNTGKIFFKDQQVYSFNLLPKSGHQQPAFINLQQYYVEGYLVERALKLPLIDLRWKNKVVDLQQDAHCTNLTIATPDGNYTLRAQYVIAADGAHSSVRRIMGLDSVGRTFKDRFLIADIKMHAPFPSERWFWFDPPFHPNQSVLLHRQPDNMWRIDFQLGWDADPTVETKPENVIPRIWALLGHEAKFELEWVSVYTFSCLRMEKFRHDRVLFAGDAAHRVSPFGARGANSGVQDADNVAWKLALVLKGLASDNLLDSYAEERELAADENILCSTRSTDFITPKSPVSRFFRDAVLQLSNKTLFARQLVNSGRLSTPSVLLQSSLTTPDSDVFATELMPGSVAVDAPVRINGNSDWLLAQLRHEFTGVYFHTGCVTDLNAQTVSQLNDLQNGLIPFQIILIKMDDPLSSFNIDAHLNSSSAQLTNFVILEDVDHLAAQRYDAEDATFYLIRPDQHICARWRQFDVALVEQALQKACGIR